MYKNIVLVKRKLFYEQNFQYKCTYHPINKNNVTNFWLKILNNKNLIIILLYYTHIHQIKKNNKNNITECKDDEYKCADNTCIPEDKMCDGELDCSQGEDEEDCTSNTGNVHANNNSIMV